MAAEVKNESPELVEIKGLIAELRAKQEDVTKGQLSQAEFAEREQKLNERIDELETKMARPPFGGGGQTQDTKPSDEAHKSAFLGWMRKGAVGPEESKFLATDDDTMGGYMVPKPMRGTMIEYLVEISPIRQYANAQTITGNAYEIPKETGTFAAGWTSERGARTETATGTIGLEIIGLHEMYAKPKVTQTMLDDASFDVEGWINRKLAEQFAYTENLAFLSGTGSGQPEGILTNTSVTDYHSGVADAITCDGMLGLPYGLKTFYARGGNYFLNRRSMRAVRLLKDGDGQYLWQPAVDAGQPPTFNGYRLIEVPDMPDIATGTYPVFFGNLQVAYQIVDKATVAMLRDPYSSKPFVEFYTTRRTGGQVVQANALIKLHIAA